MSAEIFIHGHAHAFSTFPVQIVHLVVDSGELVQPDVTFCLGAWLNDRLIIMPMLASYLFGAFGVGYLFL